MLHVWVIALFGVIVAHDAMPRLLSSAPLPLWVSLAGPPGLMLVIAALQHIVLIAAAAGLKHEGAWRKVLLAERTLIGSRLLAVLVHALNILLLGWLDAVRAVTGDLLMIDELLAMTPALLVLAAGWWSVYPIERHLRESSIMRDLDSGRPLYPVPTRGQWTLSNIRHQLLLSLVPMAMIGLWTEASPGVMAWLMDRAASSPTGKVFAEAGVRSVVEVGAQLAGAIAVFAITPLVMRHVWDTVRLGAGPARDRLLSMCQQCGVRVREVLVWRTHGSVINGAVMGIAGPVRYVLLTDALLDQLPDRQVDAVMAHELAHARHAHLPWLAGTLMAGIGGATTIGVYGISTIGVVWSIDLVPEWLLLTAHMAVQLGGLVVGVLVFGFVSRQFEWQADAFAARHMSLRDQSNTSGVISADGAGSMTAALESVARLNHVPRERSSFRHGSIGLRQRKLEQLIGVPQDRLPIDRSVRRIKMGVLATGLVVISVLVVDAVKAGRGSDIPEQAVAHTEGVP